MDVALLVVRGALAVVFAVAGVAKLADREGSRKAAADFGVPGALAGTVGLGLPLAELAVATLLLPSATAAWGALAALALLLAFSVAIGASIARGQAPDCHCFGQLHSEPAGWRTLGRNLVLAGAAVFVIAAGWSDPGTSAVAWIGRLHRVEVAVAVVGAIAAVALALAVAAVGAFRRLSRRLAVLEARPAGSTDEEPDFASLPVGVPAPSFGLRGVDGAEWTLERLLERGKPVLLFFTDPNCGPCEALMPDLARWQRDRFVDLTLAVVNAGPPTDVAAKARQHGLDAMLLDEDRKVADAYEVPSTPGAVLVAPDGRIARLRARGAHEIQELIEELTGVATPPFQIGDEMPDFVLPDLDGHLVELGSLRGAETLLLFWEPEEEECRAIHVDVLAWEAERNGTPTLVIVSQSTDVERLREEGFRAPVLLDEESELTSALLAGESPSALLFDADGRLAWPLAVGGEHILRLLRSSSLLTRS